MNNKQYNNRNTCQNHSDCYSDEYCDSELYCYSCIEYHFYCDSYNNLCPGHCQSYNSSIEECDNCIGLPNVECVDNLDCIPYCLGNTLNYDGQCNLDTNICTYQIQSCELEDLCFVNDWGEGYCVEVSDTPGCGICNINDCGYDNFDIGCYCDEFCSEYGDCCPNFNYYECCGGEILGCTDSGACNYNPNATAEDNSCYYGVECFDGSYECDETDCPDDILLGDVNFDGQVNVSDIVIIIQYVLGSETPTTEQFTAADVNGDGIINVLDVVALVQLILRDGNMTRKQAQTIMRHMRNLPGVRK